MKTGTCSPLKFLSLVFFVTASPAWAWNLHYLITDRSLPSRTYFQDELEPVALESFLVACQRQVGSEIDSYYSWLEQQRVRRFKKIPFDTEHPSVESFVRALRINPSVRFFQVNRVLPGQTARYPSVPYQQVLPIVDQNRAYAMQFEDVTGQKVTTREILTTYSDEPDWGMDVNLWKISDYGYGASPYGGEDSPAPFHMQFFFEDWLMRTSSPEMQDGMADQRIELFQRLARAAFRCGQDYWGWRFSAWSLHYAQDLSLPYHARAVPSVTKAYMLKYLLSSAKSEMKNTTTQTMKNRHFAYEDIVGYLVQDTYLNPAPENGALSWALMSNGSSWRIEEGAEYSLNLARRVSAIPAQQAHQVDNAVVAAIGRTMTDPAYDITRDTDYRVEDVVARMPKEAKERLFELAAEDLVYAGQVTRTLLLDILSDAGK